MHAVTIRLVRTTLRCSAAALAAVGPALPAAYTAVGRAGEPPPWLKTFYRTRRVRDGQTAGGRDG